MNLKRMIVIATIAIAGIPVVTGCSTVSTDSGQVAVHVNDYVMIPTDKTLAGCVQTSSFEVNGPGDDYYMYPAGERTYKFSNTKDSDGPAITIVKGNVPLTTSGVVSFNLNQACDVLKEFHKKVGVKLWGDRQKPAYVNDDEYSGWNAMLDTYIEQAIQSAATAAAAQIKADYLAIYNGDGRAELEKAMSALIPVYVNQLMGGDYFTGFRLVVNKPTIDNQQVLEAISSKQVAILQNEAQQQRNAAVQTELQSIKALVAVLGPQGYTDYVRNQLTKQQNDLIAQAIATGKITMLPIPYGSTATIPYGNTSPTSGR